jgi:cytochrome c nitrite reductase small subunit
MRAIVAAAILLNEATPAMAAELHLPRPHGWIGTVTDWMRGFGIVFALLSLLLLLLAWRSLRAGHVSAAARGLLLVGVGLIPVMVNFNSFGYGLETSSTVGSCGACHTMTPFVRDMENVKSDSLAATHFKNRFIQQNQCFTCHSNYGLGGTMQAKLQGVHDVWRQTTGTYTLPIKMLHPFPNIQCLACHATSQAFLNSDGHPKELMPDLFAGNTSCIDCHGPAHTVQKEAMRK